MAGEQQGGAGAGGDAGGAAAGGAGAGAGAGGAGGAAGEGAAGGAGAGGAAASTWFDSIGNAETKAWVAGKGWAGLEAAMNSAHHLERMIGAPADEIVRIGKNPDAATLRTVYTRLGLPETPDKYEFPTTDGVPQDQNYIAHMRAAFHKAGVPASMVKELVAANDAFAKAAREQAAKDYEANYSADVKALQGEWRAGYDKQMAKASNAAKLLGFSADAIDAIEGALGFAGTMKLFAGLADKLGEDNFVGGEGRNLQATMTPQEAKAEYDRLSGDREFVAALMNNTHPGHKQAVEKKSSLMALMYG